MFNGTVNPYFENRFVTADGVGVYVAYLTPDKAVADRLSNNVEQAMEWRDVTTLPPPPPPFSGTAAGLHVLMTLLGTILTWLILSGMMIAGKKLGIFDSDLTSMLTKLFGLLVFTGGAFIVLAIAFDDFTIWYRQRKYTRNNPIKD